MLPFCLPQHLCCPTFYPHYATYVACSFELSLLLSSIRKKFAIGPVEQGYLYCYVFWLLIPISSPFHGRKVHHGNSPHLLAWASTKQLLLAEPAGSVKVSADKPTVPDAEIVKYITGNSVPQRTTLTLKPRKKTLTTKKWLIHQCTTIVFIYN